MQASLQQNNLLNLVSGQGSAGTSSQGLLTSLIGQSGGQEETPASEGLKAPGGSGSQAQQAALQQALNSQQQQQQQQWLQLLLTPQGGQSAGLAAGGFPGLSGLGGSSGKAKAGAGRSGGSQMADLARAMRGGGLMAPTEVSR